MAAKKILIVDDEENVGTSLRLVLEGAGYSVVICRSAAEFRGRLLRCRADAYFLDVRLPDGNGIDLLSTLRQMDNQAPIIMISGHGTIADAVAESIPVEIRLPREAGAPSSLEATRAQAERELIRQALEQASGNVSAAARALGIERTRLHKRIRALGLSKENR